MDSRDSPVGTLKRPPALVGAEAFAMARWTSLSWWRERDSRLKAGLARPGGGDGLGRTREGARRGVALAWLVLGAAFLAFPVAFVASILLGRVLPAAVERTLAGVSFLLVEMTYDRSSGLFVGEALSASVLPFLFLGWYGLFAHAAAVGLGLVVLGRGLWRGRRGAAAVSVVLLGSVALGSLLHAALPPTSLKYGILDALVALVAGACAWTLRPLARFPE